MSTYQLRWQERGIYLDDVATDVSHEIVLAALISISIVILMIQYTSHQHGVKVQARR